MRKQIKVVEELNTQRNQSVINEMTGPEFKKKMESNATFKKMSSICKKYGYVLQEACRQKWGKDLDPEVVISISPVRHDSHHPYIYFSTEKRGGEGFTISAPSSGTISLKDYEEYMKEIRTAYDLVKELNKIDFNTLELRSIDD